MQTPESATEPPATATLTDRAGIGALSVRRTTIVVATATVVSNLAQLGWLAAGSRALPGPLFGDVLASQALYAVLQILLDSGTFFEGARRSAQGTLGPGDRQALQRARTGLALAGIATGLVVMAFGNTDFARTTWPYLLAVLLFARLNVWESYGCGNPLPYGAYLGLRSLLLALVVIPFAFAGGRLPAEAAGLVECVVIVVVGVLARRSSRAAGERRVQEKQPIPWRAIFLIGFPALISQYMFGLPTIMLGVSGSTLAAAAIGIGLRVLSGIQGLNGIAGASLYPRLARFAQDRAAREDLVELALLVIVALSSLALACVALIAPLLVRVLLGHASSAANDALVVSVAAAAASGLVMQLTLMLVARHAERRVMAAAICGALVLTIGGGTVLAAGGGRQQALLMASCFAMAQAVTLLMLFREARAHTPVRARDLCIATGSAASLAIVVPALTLARVGSQAVAAIAVIAVALCLGRLVQLWLLAR